MKTERAHAVLSPSSSSRWLACPGSVRLSAGMEEQSNVAAREGVFAHGVAAECLRRGVDAETLVGYTDGEFVFDEAMAEALQVYLDDARSVDAGQVWVEQRVKLAPHVPEVWGTLDHAAIERVAPRLHVKDLKFGQGVWVDPVGNTQGRCYAAGLLFSFPEATRHVERISIAMVQPRHHKGAGNLPEELSRADLLAWVHDELVPGVARTKDPAAPLAAGSHCQFCPARGTCPELNRHGLAVAQQLFADAELTQPATPDLQALTVEEVARALRAFPIVERWIAAVRERAEELARGGVAVPGFKLVEVTGHRKWKDEAGALLMLSALLPAGKSPYTVPKLVSPAAAEKLLPSRLKGTINELLAVKPTVGATLVPESDPRPALVRGADLFDDVAETSEGNEA